MPGEGAALRDEDACAVSAHTELADGLEQEAVASFSDGLNTGFYNNAFTTKQCPTMDGVLEELRTGLERLDARGEAEQARVKDELAARAAVDARCAADIAKVMARLPPPSLAVFTPSLGGIGHGIWRAKMLVNLTMTDWVADGGAWDGQHQGLVHIDCTRCEASNARALSRTRALSRSDGGEAAAADLLGCCCLAAAAFALLRSNGRAQV